MKFGDYGRALIPPSVFLLFICKATKKNIWYVVIIQKLIHRCEIPSLDINGTMSNFTDSQLSSYIPMLPDGTLDSCSLLNTTSNETIRCNSWVYNTTYYKSSRAMEWDFVCDQRWMGAVAQSIYMFGVFTGAVTLGNMADKFGRKPVFCWSAFLQLAIGVAVAFTPEYFSFLVLRYLYGIFGSAGCYIPGTVR